MGCVRMNDNNIKIKKALRDVVASYGTEVFTDINRINALLKDFLPQYNRERKLIMLALKEGMGAELQNLASICQTDRKQIMVKWERRLVSDNWITEEAAHMVVSQLVETIVIHDLGDMHTLETCEDEKPIASRRELIKGTHEQSENPDTYLSQYQIIGYKAFASNLLLETISLGDTIKVIRSKAFFQCVNLKKVEIPSSVEQIGRKVFVGCSSLSEIVTPPHGKYAGKTGFLINNENHTLLRAANTEGSTKIIIPNDVCVIQGYAFDKSTAKQIILPQSLRSIEFNAFYQNPFLESFEISPSNPHFRCIDGVIHSKDCTTLIAYPTGSPRTSYILEDGVVEVARTAFAGTSNLESITFPSGLLRVGEKAFVGCKNIRSIMLPITVLNIGERAFQDCVRLEHIMLPRGIQEIGDYAFSGCENLGTLSIPRSVVRIGNRAFNGCKKLKRVVIQDKVSFIGDGAFDGCIEGIEIAISNNPYVETYCRSRGIEVSKI